MTNRELTVRFLSLLQRQASGDGSAVDELRSLEVRQADSQCLFNLYAEWRGAFSFSPGRTAALQPILGLARNLAETKPHPSNQYGHSEWADLIALRGPVETVLIVSCDACKFESVAMGTSGFYDATGLLCGDCGNVFFKSYYDKSKLPACSCGGSYTETESRCPYESHKMKRSQISPYRYFVNHSYIRGPGA